MTMPLVLINGWAMSETVVEPLVSQLADVDVTIITLSDIVMVSGDLTLDCMVQHLPKLIPDKPVVLAGWSYGGMLACAYASAFPDNVKALVTLATNPCFIKKPDWQAGMSPAVFDEFLTSFVIAPEKTLREFSVLCSLGSKKQRQLARRLNGLLVAGKCMMDVLAMLGAADVRRQLSNICCPAMHCYGEEDALVSSEVAEKVQLCFSHHKVSTASGGHCFFLDRPGPVADLLRHYCQGGY